MGVIGVRRKSNINKYTLLFYLMKYPIVEIKTKDGLILNGLINEVPNSDTILINVHGTGGNFYEEPFIKNLFLELPKYLINSDVV